MEVTVSRAWKRQPSGRCGSRICVLAGLVALAPSAAYRAQKPADDSPGGDFVRVVSGAFAMGDVFGEGQQNEQPVHTVTLSD